MINNVNLLTNICDCCNFLNVIMHKQQFLVLLYYYEMDVSVDSLNRIKNDCCKFLLVNKMTSLNRKLKKKIHIVIRAIHFCKQKVSKILGIRINHLSFTLDSGSFGNIKKKCHLHVNLIIIIYTLFFCCL